VIGRYLGSQHATATERIWDDGKDAGVQLRRAAVRAASGSGADVIDVRTPFVIEVDYASRNANALLAARFLVIDAHGTVVFDAGPREAATPRAPGVYRDTCTVPADLMNDGTYRLEVEVHDGTEVVVKPTEALSFVIADSSELREGWHGKWVGVVRPRFDWTTTKVG
jgi:lipopolysaccharide transport system ATP-binding protein